MAWSLAPKALSMTPPGGEQAPGLGKSHSQARDPPAFPTVELGTVFCDGASLRWQ